MAADGNAPTCPHCDDATRRYERLRRAVEDTEYVRSVIRPATWKRYLEEHGWVRVRALGAGWGWAKMDYNHHWVSETRNGRSWEPMLTEDDFAALCAAEHAAPAMVLAELLAMEECDGR